MSGDVFDLWRRKQKEGVGNGANDVPVGLQCGIRMLGDGFGGMKLCGR